MFRKIQTPCWRTSMSWKKWVATKTPPGDIHLAMKQLEGDLEMAKVPPHCKCTVLEKGFPLRIVHDLIHVVHIIPTLDLHYDNLPSKSTIHVGKYTVVPWIPCILSQFIMTLACFHDRFLPTTNKSSQLNQRKPTNRFRKSENQACNGCISACGRASFWRLLRWLVCASCKGKVSHTATWEMVGRMMSLFPPQFYKNGVFLSLAHMIWMLPKKRGVSPQIIHFI